MSGDRALHEAATAAGKPRDWAARRRSVPADPIEYSRFVTLMKRVLPISAAVVLAAVLVYAFLPRQSDKMSLTYATMGRIENDLAMMKPRLTGSDAKGNPFVVTADVAVQDARNLRRARLKNVEADMSLDRQRWINASAMNGLYDMDAGTLALSDGLSVYSDSGYELHTPTGHVDLKKGDFSGSQQVTGQGPLGSFRADRFKLDRATHMVLLEGNVRMTMYLHKAKGKQ